MAKFKDPVITQIVDDLNVLNEGTIPTPLLVSQCELQGPLTIVSNGSANTQATLAITQPDVNYSGSMRIQYRRLDLATLVTASSRNITFIGVTDQAKSLAEILQKFSASLASYLLPELEDTGPYDLNREITQVVLQPKSNSLVLAPESITLNVQTAPVDIGEFSILNNISTFTSSLPFPVAGTTQDEIKELIVSRLFLANAQTQPITHDAFDFEILPAALDYTYGSTKKVKVTITDPDNFYTGEQTFVYILKDYGSMVDLPQSGYPVITYNEGETINVAIANALNAKNLYATPEDFYPGPIKPIRDVDYSSSVDTTFSFGSDESLVFQSTNTYPSGFKCVATTLYPFEEIIRFVVSSAGNKKILTTTNTTTMPVTIELLEKPAEFSSSSLAVDVNFTTLLSLPVGTYKIRITRPDSYRTPLTHHQSSSVNASEINVTEVFKVKGHDLTNLFAYNTSLTTVYPGAFDESTYTYRARQLFLGCSSLASLPDHIFDAMTRCHDWQGALASTVALTVIPDELFGFLTAYKPDCLGLFNGAGPEVIPTNLFKNAHWLVFNNIFQNASNIKTISTGFIAAMKQKVYADQVSNMFINCTSLQNVPADLFVGLAPPLSTVVPYYGFWSFNSVFYGCTALTTVPAGLFSPFANTEYNTLSFQNTFQGCTSFNAIPQGLFDGLQFPSNTPGLANTFQGCIALTSIRGDIFRNCVLGKALGFDGVVSGNGTFANTGLTSIPADLFVGNETSVEGMVYTFANTKITALPANLLAGCTAMNSVAGAFFQSALLTTVPSDLFAGAPNLINMEGVFRECPLLTSIPAGLFANQVNATKMPYMFWGSGLTSIPAGLFDTNVKVQTVEGVFLNCPITGVASNLFVSHPELTNVSYALSGTRITNANANTFAGALAITNVRSLFYGCKQLTSVDADIFKYQTELVLASGLFGSTDVLTTVPSTLFQNCTKMTEISFMFATAKGLTTIPATLFQSSKATITSVQYLASGAIALTEIPATLFQDMVNVTGASNCFEKCTTLTTVPSGLFSSFSKCTNFDSAFDGCTGITTIGTNLFATNTNSVSLVSVFDDCHALTAVPDQIFFALKNISNLRMAFMNCYSLTTVGRLVANTMSTKIEIGGLLGGDLVNTGPSQYPNITIADNLIDSTIQVKIGAYGFLLPFNRRTALTKNIDNLFGANCKFEIASYETKGYFAGMQITGSGTNFITKHAVPTTTTGFFTGSTGLSDYASLPAWAKA